MAYQVRFESNAFQADSVIGRLLDGLSALSRGAKRTMGMRTQEFEGNELRRLRGINQRTFERVMDWADNDFDQQMASEKWRWNDNQTRRKNGQIAGNPRDIIDTGDLLQSKERTQVSSSVVDFTWTDEVAELVHDGGTTKNGGAYPARPWTEPTLDELDGLIDSMLRNGGR